MTANRPKPISRFEARRHARPELSDSEIITQLCEELLSDAEAEPPIPVERVASVRGIAEIHQKQQPWAGMMGRVGRNLVVWVRSSDGYERQRFTVCHETAHTFFTGYADGFSFRCNGARTMLEDRCDTAAGELLLPGRFFAPDLEESAFGLEGIEFLARAYEASIEATARRAIDLWPEPAALLVLRCRHKPSERGHEAEVEPLLRLDYAHVQGEWPFFRRHKSVDSLSPFGRAAAGELIDGMAASLGELVASDGGRVEVHARRYGNEGRVLAVIRRPGPTSRASRRKG